VVLEARDTLLRVIVPALKLRTFLHRGPKLASRLAVNRPKRPLQMNKMAEILKIY
jgi:hypothetical protein